jgi:hypothetical protein
MVEGHMRDNDGAVRIWMLVAGAWSPFLVLGLLSMLAAWLIPAGNNQLQRNT